MRARLAIIHAWLVVAALGCSDACGPLLGPLLGAVSDHGVKVWMRAGDGGSLRVRHWPAGNEGLAIQSPPVELLADHDFTGVVSLDGLDADTAYEYRLELTPDSCSSTSSPVHTFHTLPEAGSASRIRFAIGADIWDPDVPGLEEIRKLRPDFVLLTGDQVYQDASMPSLEGFRSLYRRIWGGVQFRALFAEVPVFMIWDDHETAMDAWPGRYPDRDALARQTFDEYQGNHNPAPLAQGELYYLVRAGGAELFMLDLRSHRSPSSTPDGPNKTMLGSAQKAALLDWLASDGAPVKIIVTSVPMHEFTTTDTDAWVGARTERDEILEQIRTRSRGSVLLVTGDQHWSGVFRSQLGASDPYVLYELQPTPIGISNLPATTAVSDEILARDDDHEVFGVLDVDTTAQPARVDYTLCQVGKACTPHEERAPGPSEDVEGPAENLPYSLHLIATDRGFDAAP